MGKEIKELQELVKVQGMNGTWNYDPYMQGMFNGMELMLAVLEDREPQFRSAPPRWLCEAPSADKLADDQAND